MTAEPARKALTAGGCQCGAVRYAIYALPTSFNICHCRMCQKAVGGPFAALVPIRATDFAWTRGTPGTFASSNIASRDFCRDCGTPLAYRGPSGRINVTYGSIDDPGRAKPGKQYGIEGRWAWIDDLGKLPGLRTDEDLTSEQIAMIVNHQHPDHDTRGGWKAKV